MWGGAGKSRGRESRAPGAGPNIAATEKTNINTDKEGEEGDRSERDQTVFVK